MTESEARKIAARFAEEHGYDVARYDSTVSRKDSAWEIYFQRKSADKPAPGDFFTVYVDDQSGAAPRIGYGK